MYPYFGGVCFVCLLLCKEKGSSPVSLRNTEMKDMGLYEVPLSMLLFGIGNMWMNQNMLKLNDDKTELIVFT